MIFLFDGMNDGSMVRAFRGEQGPADGRIAWAALILLVATGVGIVRPPGGHAHQAPSRSGQNVAQRDTQVVESIARVRQDANSDLVPDRIGDTVTVRGRSTVRQGVLPDSSLVFVQDATAGIAVQMPDRRSVQRGDSLQVTGVVRHQYGLTRLHALDYTRVQAVRQVPDPVPLTVSTAHGETYEGELVRVRGRVVANRTNDGGRYLLLRDRAQNSSARLAVFIPTRRRSAIPLEGYEVGDEVTVRGVLGQHDFSAPYDGYYQILPRDDDDFEVAGLMSTYYRTIIILLIAGALLAAIAVFTLRAAVRRRTEQLAESRARFRRLAEATFEGIIIHEDGEIIDVNRALTDMTGYERDDLVGRPFREVLSASTEAFVRDGTPLVPDEPYEAVMVRADGSSFPAEIEEKVVDLPSRRVHVAAIRNVTERKQWETEILLAKEEAEQMARLKSSLLNNMSHELRTPITSIIGYAELIMNEPEGDHQGFAARIRQSGKRLSRTLQSVLEMAQIESGTLDVQPHDVDVDDLVREVVDEHRSMRDEDTLSLEVQVADAVELLYTDRALAYRALGNLVHNAVKFTEKGMIQVEAEPADPGVRIAVRDTGVGIDPDVRDRIFEPFKQESEGRARTHEGTGLGLALTKRMVDLLGGTVEVESVKGEGSTFLLELPPVVPSEKTVVEAETA